MRSHLVGLALACGLALLLPACSDAQEASDDDDDGGSSGQGGSGGASGGTGGNGGVGGASGGTGGATGGSGGTGGAGTGGSGGSGGGSVPCDTSGLVWEDPGCPAGYLRSFGEPICANLYKCVIGYACIGLACDSCVETVAVGYAMNDVCISGITAEELRDECLLLALDYSLDYPECAPEG